MKPKYQLPFPKSIEKRIGKPAGEFAHENFPESRHAIDFILGVGTPILAARGGKVVKTKFDSDKWGVDAKLAGEANYVAIDHGDGTYAEYLHLGKDRITVTVGQEVRAGDLLGYSGLSGCMSEPHLHLNVFRVANGKGVSIPIRFSK